MKYGRMRGNKREVTIGTAHTDTVNSLNETNKQINKQTIAGSRKNDMNTDIDDSDCIVVQKGGGEVGKRSVEVMGSPDPPNADASAPSPEAGERAEDGRGGWAMITRRKSKAASAASTSLQLAKTARVFASSSELERKRKAEQSIANQIAALREMVL
jgi:hypothetical protein